ncbi:short-subunit dehydrogenase [Kitasatospora sp. MAP12-15]|uniref:SDR family NAD(P)-dependent oxidoreductase n=1 Tax=unclassified Kitasatospora TaxID=2633591 RepID=UPI0024765882|nr:SDR family NAD(P)-dependent oxidoreductase [Kitasatospora sp. MAP12-44]MDH6108314.1 short-subunit dehydrogenase [Kitasatospora sp. MAP12-44]
MTKDSEADGRPVVLVTGASSGIGAATCARLARVGWYPLLSGTDTVRLAEIARRTGGTALPGDLSESDGPEELARRALAVSGRVDALIANAGVGWRGPFTGMPLDRLNHMVALNLTAPLRLARVLLPGMVERGSGCLVLTGSIVGRLGVREEAVYSATKAALGMFAESLRYELQGTGVRVRLLLPGVVDTPYFSRRGTPYHRDRPRPVSPERIAEAALALLTGRREEAVVPGWLRVPERLHGAAPALFRRLAGRFD